MSVAGTALAIRRRQESAMRNAHDCFNAVKISNRLTSESKSKTHPHTIRSVDRTRGAAALKRQLTQIQLNSGYACVLSPDLLHLYQQRIWQAEVFFF